VKTGDIILIPFPFADFTGKKLRPTVVITETNDKYKDIIVAAISSVVPKKTTKNEIVIEPSKTNKLRTKSIIKVDRIVTLKRKDLVVKLGKLSKEETIIFKEKFKTLVD